MASDIELSRSEFAENFLHLDGEPFSLDQYPFMRRVYDSDAKDKVLKFSRQCVAGDQIIELANGREKQAKDVEPGDPVIGFDTKTYKNETTPVKNVWDNGETDIYRITTRMGHTATVTKNHPFWLIDGWTNAEDLNVGDRAAVSWDNSCSLPEEKTVPDWKYKVAAYLLAEGSISTRSLGFISSNKKYAEELQQGLKNIHPDIKLKALPEDEYPYQYRINGIGSGYKNPVRSWLEEVGMFGHNSQSKSHPDFVWNLTEDQLRDYLRIWWDCDGWISNNKGTFEIEIALISEELISGLRSLLLRLGLPTRFKIKKQPEVYEDTEKQIHRLSVLGQQNKRKFFDLIDTDKAPLNPVFKETNGKPFFYDYNFIYSICKQKGYTKKGDLFYRRKNNVSIEKLGRMAEESGSEIFNRLLEADHYYDKITDVEHLGTGPSTAIEVERTHNFQIDNLLTSNTGKSTSLANMMVANSAMIPNFNSLYISPSVDQTKIFSNDRVKPVIEKSPFIKKYLHDHKTTVQNVFNKELLNGSRMYLKYVYLDADRIRGLSTDNIYIDEAQDMISDAIPVIRETMTRSEYKWTVYSGTPKRTTGTLADAWFDSTMYEYSIRCEACNKWNILDMENIGLEGLICDRCGSALSPYKDKGQWVSTYPHPEQMPDREGYRICSLHFAEAPWVDWDKDIIYKMENTSKAMFFNETLAIEHDSGALPITKEQILRACNQDLEMDREPGPDSKGRPAIMGIDYGPVNSEKSHTVISIVQPRGDELQVVYAKKFTGKEADYSFIHEEIPRLMKKWNCELLAADYGMGEAPNSEFRNRLGEQKVMAFQHLPTQKERIRWQSKMNAYTLNRNQAFIEFFKKLKNKNMKLPSRESFEPFIEEIRNIQKEYDEDRNNLKYVSQGPDDFVHATIFAMISAEVMFGIKSDTF